MAPTFFTLALDEGELLASRPDRFAPLEWTPGIHCTNIWGWMGPSVDVVEERISYPYLESNVYRQPVVRRCTDWAVPAPSVFVFCS